MSKKMDNSSNTMKKNIVYVMAMLLPLLMGCKQGSNAATDEAAADSLAADTAASVEAPSEEVAEQSALPDVTKYWNRFQEMYEEDDLDDIHYPLTKYAFIDIDEDGIQEVWVRTENDEDGVIFCFDDEGEPVYVIAETEGKRLSIAKGWVGNGYPAGGPSYFNHYVVLKDSHVEYNFVDFQIEERHEYYLGDTEITEAEAKEIKKHIQGEGYERNPEWHKK